MRFDSLFARSADVLSTPCLVLMLALGCGQDDTAEPRGEPAEEAADETSEVAESDAPASALFPQRDGEHATGGPTQDAACDFLTAARAAALLEVPEDELEARGNCTFRWRSDTEVAHASVGRVYVYDDLEASRTSFRTATANRGAEDTQREAAAVHEGAVDELGESGRAVGDATREVFEGGADFEQRYEPVEGIGDEAAFARHDGQLIVRIANMRFAVTAYRCPREPERPSPTREQLRDLGELARQARAYTQQWIADTIDVRRRMALELGRQVVGALEEYRASL